MIRKMRKKVVIFDFDGTIADTLPYILEIINLHAHEFGYKKLSTEKFGDLRNKSPKEIIRQFKIPFLKLPFILIRGRSELKKKMDRIDLFPGIKQVLETLKKQGITLGILSSNSEENVMEFIKNHHLEKTFDFIHSEFNLFGKAEALKNLLKKNKVKSDEVIYIGDEVRDIEACKKLGLEIIAVTWGFNSKEALIKFQPTFIIDRPEEILIVIGKKDNSST